MPSNEDQPLDRHAPAPTTSPSPTRLAATCVRTTPANEFRSVTARAR